MIYSPTTAALSISRMIRSPHRRHRPTFLSPRRRNRLGTRSRSRLQFHARGACFFFHGFTAGLKSRRWSESAQPVAGVTGPAAAAQKNKQKNTNLKQPASIKTSAAFYHKNTLRNGHSLLHNRDDICIPNSI